MNNLQKRDNNFVRYNNMDILRVVCSVMLIFHHYQGLSGARFDGINFYDNGRWSFGYITEVFFVISGFLTSYRGVQGNFKTYIKHKLLRIIPFALLSSFIYLAITCIYYLTSNSYMYDEKYSAIQILFAFLFVDRGWIVDFTPPFNGPMWYIDVLLICYALYFLLQKIMHRFKLNTVILPLCIAIIVSVLNIIDIQLPFLWSCNRRGYISFFMGVAVIEFIKNQKSAIINKLIGVGGVFLYGVMLFVLESFNYYGLVILFYPSIIILLTSIRQINCDMIKQMGAFQFEAYIWNVPLYSLLILVSHILNREANIEHSYLTMIGFVFFVELIAALMFNFVEKPLTYVLRKKFEIHGKL